MQNVSSYWVQKWVHFQECIWCQQELHQNKTLLGACLGNSLSPRYNVSVILFNSGSGNAWLPVATIHFLNQLSLESYGAYHNDFFVEALHELYQNEVPEKHISRIVVTFSRDQRVNYSVTLTYVTWTRAPLALCWEVSWSQRGVCICTILVCFIIYLCCGMSCAREPNRSSWFRTIGLKDGS